MTFSYNKQLKRKLLKEVLWVFGVVALTGVIGLLIFGNQILNAVPVDIQLHDTYYVFPKIFLLQVIFTSLLVATYLTRVIYFKLHNRVVNGILTLVLIIILVGQTIYLYKVHQFEGQLMEMYSQEVEENTREKFSSDFKTTKGALWTMITITTALVSIMGYKTFAKNKATGKR